MKQFMRRADINLTLSRYTHLFRGQETKAINALPDLDAGPDARQSHSA